MPKTEAVERFWMCFVEGGNQPTCKHLSEKQAKEEAERLARATKRMVYVLSPTAVCACSDIRWGTEFFDPIPF